MRILLLAFMNNLYILLIYYTYLYKYIFRKLHNKINYILFVLSKLDTRNMVKPLIISLFQ